MSNSEDVKVISKEEEASPFLTDTKIKKKKRKNNLSEVSGGGVVLPTKSLNLNDYQEYIVWGVIILLVLYIIYNIYLNFISDDDKDDFIVKTVRDDIGGDFIEKKINKLEKQQEKYLYELSLNRN